MKGDHILRTAFLISELYSNYSSFILPRRAISTASPIVESAGVKLDVGDRFFTLIAALSHGGPSLATRLLTRT